MILREYQQKAVDWLCEHERGLVVAPAGSGKTVIAAAALAKCMGAEPEHDPLVGWMANTKEQCQQATAACSLVAPFSLPRVQVACAAAGMDWSNYDVLVVDEAHHATAPEWCKQIESCQGVRWGFTATPWGRDRERNDKLRSLFGNNVYVIEREEVGGNLAPARVVWLDACDDGLPERIEAETDKVLASRMRFARYRRMSPAQARGEVAWGVCCEMGITNNNRRNMAAVSAALNHDEPTVLLCNTVEHAKALAVVIGGVACYSGMARRAETIKRFKDGEIKRLVATSMLDEGADLPCIAVLILCGAGRSEGRTIQRAGRALRPFPGKTEAIIYDFKDSAIPLMARHAAKRSQIYQKLGYSGAELDSP